MGTPEKKMLIAVVRREHTQPMKTEFRVREVNHRQLAEIREYSHWVNGIPGKDSKQNVSGSWEIVLINTKRLRKQYLPRNAMYQRSRDQGKTIELRRSGTVYFGQYGALPFVRV